MRLRALVDLRSDVRLRADVMNAVIKFPDSEINEYVNQAWTKVYGRLAHTGEKYYVVRPAPVLNTAANQDTYFTTGSTVSPPAGTAILPLDMWNIVGVDIQVNGPRWQTCQRSQFDQRNDFQDASFAWPTIPLYSYEGSGNNACIIFNPMPPGIYPFRLWYYQAATRLVKDDDTLDGGNGWERMAVDIAARWVAERDENFELAGRLDMAIAEWDQRLEMESASRNTGQPPKVRRSQRYKRDLLWRGRS